jgi:hypothetical protein
MATPRLHLCAASERLMCVAQVVAVMLQLHIRRLQDPTESGIVLVLGCMDWQRDMLRAELRRLIPELAHVVTVSNNAVLGGSAAAGRCSSCFQACVPGLSNHCGAVWLLTVHLCVAGRAACQGALRPHRQWAHSRRP